MDDDNLYFNFDQEPDDDSPEAEEGQNRGFLIGAVVLGAVFVLGICAVVIILLTRGQQPQISENEIANMTNAAIATSTAQFMADQAATAAAGGGATTEPTEPANGVTEEATQPVGGVDATATPGGLGVTVTVENGATEEPTGEAATGEAATGEATEEGTVEATSPGTQVAGVASPTPLQQAATPTGAATSGVIEVTQIGGAATPTRIGGGTAVGGSGGPIQPTAQATLPTTGFSANAGLAGAGMLALALVVVAAVVRYVRMR